MATKKPQKASVKKGEQSSKLDTMGLDAVCERIERGESVGQFADALGMDRSTTWRWINADAQRSTRVKESLRSSAHGYADKAERVLLDLKEAATQAEITRARELASHYRWCASKRDPGVFGDKLDLNHSGKIEMTDDQVNNRVGLLLAKLGLNAAPQDD